MSTTHGISNLLSNLYGPSPEHNTADQFSFGLEHSATDINPTLTDFNSDAYAFPPLSDLNSNTLGLPQSNPMIPPHMNTDDAMFTPLPDYHYVHNSILDVSPLAADHEVYPIQMDAQPIDPIPISPMVCPSTVDNLLMDAFVQGYNAATSEEPMNGSIPPTPTAAPTPQSNETTTSTNTLNSSVTPTDVASSQTKPNHSTSALLPSPPLQTGQKLPLGEYRRKYDPLFDRSYHPQIDNQLPWICPNTECAHSKQRTHFRTKQLLTKHYRRHTEFAFKCNICNKAFGRKTNLADHSRVHSGEKPFKCEICQQRFQQKHGLQTHLKIHSGEKPFHCRHCGKRFVVAHNLRSHIDNVHTYKDRIHQCDGCPKRYKTETGLRKHRQSKHPTTE